MGVFHPDGNYKTGRSCTCFTFELSLHCVLVDGETGPRFDGVRHGGQRIVNSTLEGWLSSQQGLNDSCVCSKTQHNAGMNPLTGVATDAIHLHARKVAMILLIGTTDLRIYINIHEYNMIYCEQMIIQCFGLGTSNSDFKLPDFSVFAPKGFDLQVCC